jgi:hypothetical protein
MNRLLLLFSFCLPVVAIQAQGSDIISVRKANGRVIKSFTSGVPITFYTRNNNLVQGTIRTIRNDSVLINSYATRIVPTHLGVTIVDTVARWVDAVDYRDIKNVEVFRRRRFVRGKIGRLLMIGGAGYLVLNLFNGKYLNQPLNEKENLRSLSTAAMALGSGIIIQKYFPVNRFTRKRHQIVYIPIR